MPSTTHVFVGVATHDTIALVDRYPDADERIVATELMHAGGGPAATAAVAAARLGVPAAFVGSVGDDTDADAILDGLAAEGVDVSGVAHSRQPFGVECGHRRRQPGDPSDHQPPTATAATRRPRP